MIGSSDSSRPVFTVGFELPGVTPVQHFVARGDELTELHEVLSKGKNRRSAVIHGLGGMGKTQLAVEYAKRHQDDYSAVFWFNARDQASLKQGFLRTAERILQKFPSVVYIKNAIESHDLDEAVGAVKRWFDVPENSRWLIIYDNYDNPILDESDEKRNKSMLDTDGDSVSDGYDIRMYLPDAYHGAVLITTRSSRIQFAHRILLKKLQHVEESLEIIAHTSGRQNLERGKSQYYLEHSIKLTAVHRYFCRRTCTEIRWTAACSFYCWCLFM
jgi:hypothetical protein